MSSKFRKLFKALPNVFMVLGAVSVAFAMLLSMVNLPVSANGKPEEPVQEVCPNKGEVEGEGVWEKKDGLTGTSFTYTAPDGKLISKWCYKAATTVNKGDVIPPDSSVTITSTVKNKNGEIQEISHASFLLITDAGEEPPGEEPPGEEPPGEEPPGEEPQDPNNPSDPNDPDETDDPVDPVDPVDDENNNDPQTELDPPTTTSSQTVLIPVTGIEFGTPMSKTQSVAFNLGIGLLGVGLVLQSIRKKIQ